MPCAVRPKPADWRSATSPSRIRRHAAQGDLASAVCFDLARTARKPPRALAEALVAAFVPGDGIVRLEAAGSGYVNAFLDRPNCLRDWLAADRSPRPAAGGKVIVEHTNINPNKAAHIGHLRNAVLGDTLVRSLETARPARRDPELHRRYGRPGRRPRGRLSRAARRRPGRGSDESTTRRRFARAA